MLGGNDDNRVSLRETKRAFTCSTATSDQRAPRARGSVGMSLWRQEPRPPPRAEGLGGHRASGVLIPGPRGLPSVPSPGHDMETHLPACPQQCWSSPHLLEFVHLPASPPRPGELVPPTSGAGASPARAPAPPAARRPSGCLTASAPSYDVSVLSGLLPPQRRARTWPRTPLPVTERQILPAPVTPATGKL